MCYGVYVQFSASIKFVGKLTSGADLIRLLVSNHSKTSAKRGCIFQVKAKISKLFESSHLVAE